MERAQLSTAQGKERPQLIAARERMHLSLEEVGERVGVSKTTVYRWEKKGDIPLTGFVLSETASEALPKKRQRLASAVCSFLVDEFRCSNTHSLEFTPDV